MICEFVWICRSESEQLSGWSHPKFSLRSGWGNSKTILITGALCHLLFTRRRGTPWDTLFKHSSTRTSSDIGRCICQNSWKTQLIAWRCYRDLEGILQEVFKNQVFGRDGNMILRVANPKEVSSRHLAEFFEEIFYRDLACYCIVEEGYLEGYRWSR